jgi:hypothetical protein
MPFVSQSTSQMAQLFYGGLGQVAGISITTTHNGSYTLFSQMQDDGYWAGPEAPQLPDAAWLFFTNAGFQTQSIKSNHVYALAVAPGDISAVPLPDAAWLLGSGLMGLAGLRRKGKQS